MALTCNSCHLISYCSPECKSSNVTEHGQMCDDLVKGIYAASEITTGASTSTSRVRNDDQRGLDDHESWLRKERHSSLWRDVWRMRKTVDVNTILSASDVMLVSIEENDITTPRANMSRVIDRLLALAVGKRPTAFSVSLMGPTREARMVTVFDAEEAGGQREAMPIDGMDGQQKRVRPLMDEAWGMPTAASLVSINVNGSVTGVWKIDDGARKCTCIWGGPHDTKILMRPSMSHSHVVGTKPGGTVTIAHVDLLSGSEGSFELREKYDIDNTHVCWIGGSNDATFAISDGGMRCIIMKVADSGKEHEDPVSIDCPRHGVPMTAVGDGIHIAAEALDASGVIIIDCVEKSVRVLNMGSNRLHSVCGSLVAVYSKEETPPSEVHEKEQQKPDEPSQAHSRKLHAGNPFIGDGNDDIEQEGSFRSEEGIKEKEMGSMTGNADDEALATFVQTVPQKKDDGYVIIRSVPGGTRTYDVFKLDDENVAIVESMISGGSFATVLSNAAGRDGDRIAMVPPGFGTGQQINFIMGIGGGSRVVTFLSSGKTAVLVDPFDQYASVTIAIEKGPLWFGTPSPFDANEKLKLVSSARFSRLRESTERQREEGVQLIDVILRVPEILHGGWRHGKKSWSFVPLPELERSAAMGATLDRDQLTDALIPPMFGNAAVQTPPGHLLEAIDKWISLAERLPAYAFRVSPDGTRIDVVDCDTGAVRWSSGGRVESNAAILGNVDGRGIPKWIVQNTGGRNLSCVHPVRWEMAVHSVGQTKDFLVIVVSSQKPHTMCLSRIDPITGKQLGKCIEIDMRLEDTLACDIVCIGDDAVAVACANPGSNGMLVGIYSIDPGGELNSIKTCKMDGVANILLSPISRPHSSSSPHPPAVAITGYGIEKRSSEESIGCVQICGGGEVEEVVLRPHQKKVDETGARIVRYPIPDECISFGKPDSTHVINGMVVETWHHAILICAIDPASKGDGELGSISDGSMALYSDHALQWCVSDGESIACWNGFGLMTHVVIFSLSRTGRGGFSTTSIDVPRGVCRVTIIGRDERRNGKVVILAIQRPTHADVYDVACGGILVCSMDGFIQVPLNQVIRTSNFSNM
jgi:hypothetical protein